MSANVTTPLPAELDPQAVIGILHDHTAMINALAPGNTDAQLISGEPSGNEPCVYHVTAPTPMGKSTYPLTITNVADGADTLVQPKPPVGKLEIRGKWRVAGGKLTESVEIDGNFMTKK